MLLLPEHSVSSTNVIHQGDALAVLRRLPSNFVHCLVTSPPFYGLRDYNVNGQLGLEDIPQAYLARLVAIFREARRVLRDDGVAWVNMGDSYAAQSQGKSGTGEPYRRTTSGKLMPPQGRAPVTPGFKPKDLMLMPHRLAIALQSDGWWVRSDIVWHKPNPMPESVTDRPTKAHEYIFMLTKAERYWYDADAVREEGAGNLPWGKRDGSKTAQAQEINGKHGGSSAMTSSVSRDEAIDRWYSNGRNLRSVWTVATQPYAAAHFATYPPDLIRPCIRAGCPERVCPVCGRGWVRETEPTPEYAEFIEQEKKRRGSMRSNDLETLGLTLGKSNKSVTPSYRTLGFRPDCDCGAADWGPGITLDPFMGSGTTALVAKQERRRYVGIELNRDYIALAEQRFMTGPEKLNAKTSEPLTDLPLFADVKESA